MSHREIEAVLGGVSSDVRAILARALSGEDLELDHAVRLFAATGRDLVQIRVTFGASPHPAHDRQTDPQLST